MTIERTRPIYTKAGLQAGWQSIARVDRNISRISLAIRTVDGQPVTICDGGYCCLLFYDPPPGRVYFSCGPFHQGAALFLWSEDLARCIEEEYESPTPEFLGTNLMRMATVTEESVRCTLQRVNNDLTQYSATDVGKWLTGLMAGQVGYVHYRERKEEGK